MTRLHRLFILLLTVFAGLSVSAGEAANPPLTNLAAHHAATASGSRARMGPELAVDGDPKTRWSTDDAKAASWWMVDLGAAHELGGCEITWERKLIYAYAVEGSLDGTTWTMLNDQRGSERQLQVQRLAIGAITARYVRISIASVENNVLASIAEVQVFDAQEIKRLPVAEAQTFVADEPFVENIALNKPAICSSIEGKDRVAGLAVDGNNRTRWCASDMSKPQWWEVDLEAVRNIGGIQIYWEDTKAYRFVVEGSTDNLEWQVLVDQRNNTRQEQIQKFALAGKKARYIRITCTGIDLETKWVSIYEVKVSEAAVN